jgi:uncharacterized phage-associated protein
VSGINYDEHKFAEMILYLCRVSEGDERFGAVKLNKLLYYSDFRAFAVRGTPITGAEYQKLQFGPAPRQLLPVKRRLEADGSVKEREEGVLGMVRLLALREPDLDCFAGSDIAIVDQILGWAAKYSGTRLSKLSHAHVGWNLAEYGETIPYETVFLPAKPEPMNDAERAAMDDVAARLVARGIKLPR